MFETKFCNFQEVPCQRSLQLLRYAKPFCTRFNANSNCRTWAFGLELWLQVCFRILFLFLRFDSRRAFVFQQHVQYGFLLLREFYHWACAWLQCSFKTWRLSYRIIYMGLERIVVFTLALKDTEVCLLVHFYLLDFFKWRTFNTPFSLVSYMMPKIIPSPRRINLTWSNKSSTVKGWHQLKERNARFFRLYFRKQV